MGQALGGVFPATVADHLEPCGRWFWGDYVASVVAVFVSLPVVWIKYSNVGNLRVKGIVLAQSFGHNSQVHEVR